MENGGPGGKPEFGCIDEAGCDEEAYSLCAFQQGGGVDFLACMDGARGQPSAKAKTCASQTGLDEQKLDACFADKTTVLKAAADYFDGTHVHAVPTVKINGKNQRGMSYKALLKVLCKTGIEAKACSGADELEDSPAEVEITEIVPVATPQLV